MICENLASAKAQLLARVSAPLALSFALLRDVEPTLKSATVRCGESLALYVGTVLRLSGCSASCRVICSISVTSSESVMRDHPVSRLEIEFPRAIRVEHKGGANKNCVRSGL
jgi:hypothetical protein